MAKGAYLLVSLPASAATWGGANTVGCSAWALKDTLTAPVALDAAWIAGSLDANNYCSFATALSANTAYGVRLLGSSATAGVHAPVALSTWNTNTAADKGPRIDGNPVFDTVVVVADPAGTFAVEAVLPVVEGETTN